MPEPISAAELQTTIAKPCSERYDFFVTAVTQSEELWTIRGKDGFIVLGDNDERHYIPVWSHPDYAEAFIKETLPECSPQVLDLESFMEQWLPGLKSDERLVSVFPTVAEKRSVVDPMQLLEDLQKKSEK